MRPRPKALRDPLSLLAGAERVWNHSKACQVWLGEREELAAPLSAAACLLPLLTLLESLGSLGSLGRGEQVGVDVDPPAANTIREKVGGEVYDRAHVCAVWVRLFQSELLEHWTAQVRLLLLLLPAIIVRRHGRHDFVLAKQNECRTI